MAINVCEKSQIVDNYLTNETCADFVIAITRIFSKSLDWLERDVQVSYSICLGTLRLFPVA